MSARRKFAAGPAKAMAAFLRGGCSRNPLPRSSGASCSSGLSPANFTYPPSGSSETRYSVSPHCTPNSVMCMAGISSTASAEVREDACTQEDKRASEKERVDAVEQPAVPRQEATGVLRSVRALEHRFAEVAERAENARPRTHDHTPPPGELRQPAERLHGQRAADRGEEPAGRALPGLAGRDAR